MLVDLNPQVPDRNAALAGTGPSPAFVLARMAAGLEEAGADGLVMVCNSAHAFAPDIRAALHWAPLLSLIEETVAAVRRDHPALRRVGLLAAAACLDARLYQDAFAAARLEVIAPQGELRTRFMALLYRLKAGDLGEESRAEMRAIADGLVAQGAELIVSGCTEVPLVLSQTDIDTRWSTLPKCWWPPPWPSPSRAEAQSSWCAKRCLRLWRSTFCFANSRLVMRIEASRP